MKIDEESKTKFLEKIGKQISDPKCEWICDGIYGHWLPLENLEEGEEAFKWILRMRDFNCFSFTYEEHENIDEEFIYIPTDHRIVLKEVIGSKDKYTLGLTYKIGM